MNVIRGKTCGIPFLSLLFSAALITCPLWAQVYSGSLTGVVTDSSGGVIRGAKITLTDMGKKYDYNAVTDEVGRYLLRSLPPHHLPVEGGGGGL